MIEVGPHRNSSAGRFRIAPGGEWGWSLESGWTLAVDVDGRTTTGYPGDSAASLMWAHGERRFLAAPGQGRPAAPRNFDPFDRDGWIWLAGEGLVPASACRVVDGDVLAGLPVRSVGHRSPPPTTARRSRFRTRAIVDRRPTPTPTRQAEMIQVRRAEFSELSGRMGRSRLLPGPARRARTDVLVCGGGLAGLAAARAAAETGASVLLVEAEDHLGGACRWSGSDRARALAESAVAAVTAHSGIEVVVGATAVAATPSGQVLVTTHREGM
jgi:hypothetical protein